jgi:integrase
LISDLKDRDGLVRMSGVPKHVKALEDFVGELQDRGLAPSRIANYVKAIKALYRVNGVELRLPYSLPRRAVKKDRAPKPEELQRLLDIADLRGKVIIAMLALGGFRIGTLVRLRYRHVREDLEAGRVPIHVHIEAEITKGKYHDYDTFLGEEAAEYLRLYLEARRQGHLHPKIPPEEITDESPIIRDEMHAEPRPIGERQLYKVVHALYFKAGLLKRGQNGGYELRVHSLRKYFKTQLLALGVQPDYVDYMMGHAVDTYHDIQSKGVEFLRSIYARADLRIRPKPTISKHELVIQAIRHMLTPEELRRVEEALSEPEMKYLDPEERLREEIKALSKALRESLKRELVSNSQLPSPQG